MRKGPGMESASPEIKVLVADDSPIYRKLVEQSLSQENYSVLFATHGKQALDLFNEHHPAIVITDWSMPDISGPELCSRIRGDASEFHAHLILLTSNTEKEQVIEGLAAGADDYLTKPFHPGELLARVRVGCRITELNRQVQAKNRQLEELALTDPLTGLPNRRAVDVWVSRQMNAAARHDFPMWVVLADLDHFKRINDTYGHDAGDIVLQGFAEVLKKNTRSSNICARLGGEEFLIVITHVETRDNVTIAVERIRRQFAEMKFTFRGETVTCTASFGVAGFRGAPPPGFNQLTGRADQALYAAKNKGRNRMEFAYGT